MRSFEMRRASFFFFGENVVAKLEFVFGFYNGDL